MMLLWIGVAGAAELSVESTAFVPQPLVGWPVVELRGGVSAHADAAAPMICGEISPHRLFALDACGSGAGFLYPALPGVIDVAHFRAEATLPVWRAGRTELLLQPGIGFAEIQRGQDAPGFAFGRARSEEPVEGAGAEAAIAAKVREWVSPRVGVTAEIVVGGAFVPSAPAVLEASPLLFFAAASVGVGF